MSEQQQKPKQKPKRKALRVLGQVIRWIIISILAILLVLAIVFQAAWKITFLLVILAAGLSLIPKVHRKWFYLSIAAVVLALVIWVFLPDNNEGWRPYTFDKEIAALNTKYHVPDEENAAILYQEIIDCNIIIEPVPEKQKEKKIVDEIAEGIEKHGKYTQKINDPNFFDSHYKSND